MSAAAIRAAADAGLCEVYIARARPDKDGFFSFYEREVLPRLRQAD